MKAQAAAILLVIAAGIVAAFTHGGPSPETPAVKLAFANAMREQQNPLFETPIEESALMRTERLHGAARIRRAEAILAPVRTYALARASQMFVGEGARVNRAIIERALRAEAKNAGLGAGGGTESIRFRRVVISGATATVDAILIEDNYPLVIVGRSARKYKMDVPSSGDVLVHATLVESDGLWRLATEQRFVAKPSPQSPGASF